MNADYELQDWEWLSNRYPDATDDNITDFSQIVDGYVGIMFDNNELEEARNMALEELLGRL